MKTLKTLLLILFLCCAAGSVVSFSKKPELYHPATSFDSNGIDYKKFSQDFNTIPSADLLSNGSCGAKKNDFVVLPENNEILIKTYSADGKSVTLDVKNIAENIAAQGAIVLLLDSHAGSSRNRFSGDVYYQGGQETETKPIYGNSFTEMSGKLRRLAYRTPKILFTAAASALFLCLLVIFVLTAPLHPAKFGSKSEGNVGALVRLSRRKYSLSVISAALMLLLTYAWFVASNIYVLVEGYFNPWFFASLISLPFFFFAMIAVLNLTRFKKYRPWINIVCVVFTAIALGIILFSVMMQLK